MRGADPAEPDHVVEVDDYEQIALQLTGHARAVAAGVRRHAAALLKSDGRGALAEVVLREADGRLSASLEGTARCAQNRARLVRALYTRLDRLTEAVPAAT
ncbi:restriction endonuclease [Streptomyces griseoloalbus]|uniref:restriction endonuclease n=1 Tax=Streptomyces griseoloalbus TaxID=67303 RepID=UPI003F53FDEF